MLEAHEDTIVDLSTSCTVAEAVAKMLGWLQGPQFKKIIKTSEYGISAGELPYIAKLDDSLEHQLEKIHKAANNELYAAIEEYENCFDNNKEKKYQTIQHKIKQLKEKVEVVKKAFLYAVDINDELEKGESSALRIDKNVTNKTKIMHITIRSLHDWAKKRYDISVCPVLDTHSGILSAKAAPSEETDCVTEKLSTREKNILTTLAFLTEAFAKTKSKYQNGEEPNYKNIAEHLENLAKEANHNQRLSGQSIESIRKLLSSANDTKLQVINKKGDGV